MKLTSPLPITLIRLRIRYSLKDLCSKQRIDVRLDGETVWLTQLAMSELFETSQQNISLHLKNVFSEEELEEESVVKEYLTTA